MNTVRINGQDYTSSLSDAEIAFMGNFSLPTTAQTLSGAIAEHESDISTLNSNLVKAVKLSGSVSVSANGTGDIEFDISSLSGKTIVGHSIDSVSATNSINYITMMIPYSDTKIRVGSSTAQTITINMLYFYKG